MRWPILVALALALGACACKGKKETGGGGNGTGGNPTCEAVKAHVETLYRAEASGDNIDEQVADNTQMVMNDCAAAPDKVAPCAKDAKDVADLETRCLIPLDQEGSEGDRFTKGSK
jgi:hypothetical protein